MSKKIGFCLGGLLWVHFCCGQPNCNIYKYGGDSTCYKACLEAIQAITFPQGSKQSQIHFDKALSICPSLDYAYREKAVPYLKRGDFVTWKKLIDKAVQINPQAYLGIRGWCRYKFLRDYQGAIQDIEKLDSMVSYDIGYTGDGDYHLQCVRALSYKELGQKEKALEIMEKQMGAENYSPLSYDYLHLGVLYLQTDAYERAIAHLKKQLSLNDYLAETYYYLAITYKKLHNKEEWQRNLTKARHYYQQGKRRTDPYSAPMDKIYLVDIEQELENSW